MTFIEAAGKHALGRMKEASEVWHLDVNNALSVEAFRLARLDPDFVMLTGSSCKYVPGWRGAEAERQKAREAEILSTPGVIDVSDTFWL